MATIRTAPKAPKASTVSRAPMAPQAPKGKGGLPAAPKGKAAVMAPIMAPQAPSAPPVRRGPGRPPALPSTAPQASTANAAKEIEALKAQIAKLTADAAKAKAISSRKEQSAADIRGDEATHAALVKQMKASANGAWMLAYTEAGDATFPLNLCILRNGALTVIGADEAPPLMTYCAIPRDNDLGGFGADARKDGMIALHTVVNERGNYCRAPAYLSETEFYALLNITNGAQEAGEITARV